MSRATIVLNVLLILVIAALAWTLYARTGEGSAASGRMSVGEAGGMAAPVSGIDADTADRLVAQLARIDSRLDILEREASSRDGIAPALVPAAPGMPAAEADRRLIQMLPNRQIDHRELTQFQARLSALPQADQFALSTALSRAINENRIRMR